MQTWLVLVLFRILWTVYPQTGYIHPDEFFQGPEIVAGDLLQLEVTKTWEFNPENPIRSISIPFMISGSAFVPIKLLNLLLNTTHIMNTHILLTLPRLSVTALGFISDVLLCKLAFKLNLDISLCMFLYAISCVCLVFYTRTLSNTIESILFTVILFCAVNSYIVKTQFNIMKNISNSKENLETSSDKSGSKSARKSYQARFNVKNSDDSKIFKYSSIIGVTIAFGVFNRPTFLLFAFVPCVLWIFSEGIKIIDIIKKCLIITIYFVLTSFIFIFLDSLYYGSLNLETLEWKDVSFYKILSENLTITPLNFIKYNLQSENLAVHGIHPWYTHLTVNMLMLFGPFAVLIFLQCLRYFYYFVVGPQFKHSNIFLCISFCILTPLILLSVFPHQEARFLIPLLPIVILLTCDWLRTSEYIYTWKAIWLLFNLLTCMFFGVLHQGGLIPCISNLQNDMLLHNDDSINHFVFYHTYMPPKHLLAIPKYQKVYGKNNSLLGAEPKQFMVHDLQGASKHHLDHFIWDLMFVGKKIQKKTKVYVISPSSIHDDITEKWSKYTLHLQEQYYPHLSMEQPPKLDLKIKLNSKFLQNIKNQLKLNMYTVRVT